MATASDRNENERDRPRQANRQLDPESQLEQTTAHARLNMSSNSRTLPRPNVDLQRPKGMDAPLRERAGQCCFLCLEKGQQQVTVAVPCLRPKHWRLRLTKKTQPESVEQTVRSTEQQLPDENKDKKKDKPKIPPPQRASFECDATVFERLKSVCYEYHGSWKKWLPFYGITRVEEVHVGQPCQTMP